MEKKNKLDYVDALRGYAILLVIFAHTGQMFPVNYPSYLKSLIDFGPRGVQLFFIVSAFTLFLSGEKRFREDCRPKIAFFIRRFFRIAPLYYLGIMIYSIINIHTDSVTVGNILRNIFFIHDLYPYYPLVPGGWSISTEMLFYLIVPLLFTYIKNLNSAVWFTMITLAIAVLSKILCDTISIDIDPQHLKELNFPYLFPFSVPVFGIGISFYFVIFKSDYHIKPYLSLIAAVILLFSIIFNSGVLLMYIQTAAFGLVALALSKSHIKFIVNNVSTYFGKLSYSMYIIHFIVIDWIEYSGVLKNIPHHNNRWILIYFISKLLLSIIITSILANITYYLIEIPGQNIGRKVVKLTEVKTKAKMQTL